MGMVDKTKDEYGASFDSIIRRELSPIGEGVSRQFFDMVLPVTGLSARSPTAHTHLQFSFGHFHRRTSLTLYPRCQHPAGPPFRDELDVQDKPRSSMTVVVGSTSPLHTPHDAGRSVWPASSTLCGRTGGEIGEASGLGNRVQFETAVSNRASPRGLSEKVYTNHWNFPCTCSGPGALKGGHFFFAWHCFGLQSWWSRSHAQRGKNLNKSTPPQPRIKNIRCHWRTVARTTIAMKPAGMPPTSRNVRKRSNVGHPFPGPGLIAPGKIRGDGQSRLRAGGRARPFIMAGWPPRVTSGRAFSAPLFYFLILTSRPWAKGAGDASLELNREAGNLALPARCRLRQSTVAQLSVVTGWRAAGAPSPGDQLEPSRTSAHILLRPATV